MQNADNDKTKRPGLGEILGGFLKLGCTAFGGLAMIPYIRELSVDKKKWLTEDSFRLGMALSQSIPGATAMQVAAYVGLRARGPLGAMAAFIAFGLPAFLLITGLSAVYMRTQNVPVMLSAFTGLKIIVMAIILNATVNFARKYLKQTPDFVLALAAAGFIILGGHPIVAIVGVVVLGLVAYRKVQGAKGFVADPASRAGHLLTPGLLLALLAGWMGFLYAANPLLFDLAALMMKVDLFAFGGGFASVPLMLHEVTDNMGWMGKAEFMDGIAMGQVTPGPVVITSAFVGYYMSGIVGALVAAVAAFTPSFLILITVTPYFDRLQGLALFQRAIRASLTAMVGLLAAVTVIFARAAPWSPAGLLLGLAAFAALRIKVDLVWVVLAGAALSAIIL